MKTLEEIKDNYAKSCGYEDWDDIIEKFGIDGQIIKSKFKEHENNVFELVQIEQQKLIAENVKIDILSAESKYDVEIDKSSIINENNIIK